MLLLELAALGGVLFAGRKAIPWRRARRRGEGERAPGVTSAPPAPRETRRELAVSSVSLGLATLGAALRAPLLGLASLPGALFVFGPTFDRAWRALRQRRMDPEVLDAARVALCVVMGYTVAAALDALFQAANRQLLRRGERNFRNTLDAAFGKRDAGVWVYHAGVELETPAAAVGPGTLVVLGIGDTAPADGTVVFGCGRLRPALATGPIQEKRRGEPVAAGGLVVSGRICVLLERAPAPAPVPHALLEQAALGSSALRRLGKRGGEHLAPWMLGAFAIALPWLGANGAAAFLAIRCGGQLRELGPHTARQAIGFGARHGILVRRIRALELARLVDTLVIDARVLADPAVRSEAPGIIHVLRQRPWPATRLESQRFRVHVLAATEEEGRRLREALDLDDYFAEPSAAGRAILLRNLLLGGRRLCYVGTGDGDDAAMRNALLSVAHRPGEPLNATPADVVLSDPHLRGLPGLFEIATVFTARQGGNLSVPFCADLLAVGGSMVLHMGLVYSILISHAGFLSRVARTEFPEAGQAPEFQPPPSVANPYCLTDPLMEAEPRPGSRP